MPLHAAVGRNYKKGTTHIKSKPLVYGLRSECWIIDFTLLLPTDGGRRSWHIIIIEYQINPNNF